MRKYYGWFLIIFSLSMIFNSCYSPYYYPQNSRGRYNTRSDMAMNNELNALRHKMDSQARGIAKKCHPQSNIVTFNIDDEVINNVGYARNQELEVIKIYSVYMKGKLFGISQFNMQIEITGKVKKDMYGRVVSEITGNRIVEK